MLSTEYCLLNTIYYTLYYTYLSYYYSISIILLYLLYVHTYHIYYTYHLLDTLFVIPNTQLLVEPGNAFENVAFQNSLK